MRVDVTLAALSVAATCFGCGARTGLPIPLSDTNDTSTGGGGGAAPVSCDKGMTSLTGRIRDFSNSHPDFQKFLGDDPGIVEHRLGADRTPVYAGHPTTPTTTGAADFHQWYHDVSGVNEGRDFSLPLHGTASRFNFNDDTFFPIDGKLLGDEGLPHNYSFTLELHGQFRYQGGEEFDVAGDDDLWLFVDRRLVVNLGGVHSTEAGKSSIDSLGLDEGGIYDLDIFFAERHTTASSLRINLLGPNLCPISP